MTFEETIEEIQNHLREIEILHTRLRLFHFDKIQSNNIMTQYQVDLWQQGTWLRAIDVYQRIKSHK